ncbi:hypothetical protein Y032_0080g1345 [Ancylostoma ceylanicum]|uniref:Uncharacterized protein n=1 Tax=Ancylostoma ceylanicum TaxID=53326 RepID=A0A016TSJ3_9BILA|nr:hypothetical protein Y032_0080g1345 [Ancylostoma ceylanicum]
MLVLWMVFLILVPESSHGDSTTAQTAQTAQTPQATGETFHTGPRPTGVVSEPMVFNPGMNENQYSYYGKDGRNIVAQILKEKASQNISLFNTERLAEIVGFLFEVAEWGTKGPPSGFSISKQPRRIQRDTGAQNKSEAGVYVRKKNTEGLPNYVKVAGQFYLIPKPGSDAERIYRQRVASLSGGSDSPDRYTSAYTVMPVPGSFQKVEATKCIKITVKLRDEGSCDGAVKADEENSHEHLVVDFQNSKTCSIPTKSFL